MALSLSLARARVRVSEWLGAVAATCPSMAACAVARGVRGVSSIGGSGRRAPRRAQRMAAARADSATDEGAGASRPSDETAVVVGDGPLGAATARHLLKRGVKSVTVVDGRAVGLGSSHADRARLLRGADAEGRTDWARRNAQSLDAFAGIEADAGLRFFTCCGALMVGPKDFVTRARESAEASREGAGESLEDVSSAMRNDGREGGGDDDRWPYLSPAPGSDFAVYDSSAGYVDPLAMIEAFHAAAEAQHPGRLRVVPGEATRVRAESGGVEVSLASGQVLHAERCVIAGGALSRALLAASADDGGLFGALEGTTGSDPLAGVRVSRRTVALLQVDDAVAEGMLKDMPTIKYAFALGGGGGDSGGEQGRVESGSVYILPPVRYPERENAYYIKLGGGPNDFMAEDVGRAEIDEWLASEGDPNSAAWLESVLRALMPSVPFVGAARSMACVTTVDAQGGIGAAAAERAGATGRVTVVGACMGKAAGPADALGREVADIALGGTGEPRQGESGRG